MHRAIFEGAGKGFAWALVRDNKAHMDRVRFISLAFGARSAWEEHRAIVDCILAHDPEGAERAMRNHLGRIGDILEKAQADRPELFETPASRLRSSSRR
jgi:GntR family transcriptional regulator, rspAB operon transcriptional repressor